MKTFPAVVVANYFAQKDIDEKRPIDNLKVNKLVYLVHGWHLGFNGEPLIQERVEAWQYGTVVRSVYDALKDTANTPSPNRHPLDSVKKRKRKKLKKTQTPKQSKF